MSHQGNWQGILAAPCNGQRRLERQALRHMGTLHRGPPLPSFRLFGNTEKSNTGREPRVLLI
jgi:hypothetical protein